METLGGGRLPEGAAVKPIPTSDSGPLAGPPFPFSTNTIHGKPSDTCHRTGARASRVDRELMMRSLLVTGGAGFIGGNFVHYWLREHPAAPGRSRCADLRGQPGDDCELRGRRRMQFVHGDVADADSLPPLPDARHRHDRAFRGRIARRSSIVEPGAFVRTNVVGTQVLLDAARGRGGAAAHGATASDSITCRPTRSTARWPGIRRSPSGRRMRRTRLRGEQGRVRPSRTRVSAHVWTAGDDQQLLEQLRAVSVSGKADSADDRQRARGGRCRSTATADRFVTGCSSKITVSRSNGFGRGRRRPHVQRRRASGT